MSEKTKCPECKEETSQDELNENLGICNECWRNESAQPAEPKEWR
jgi:acetyl-CoA carboxylase beta subunit